MDHQASKVNENNNKQSLKLLPLHHALNPLNHQITIRSLLQRTIQDCLHFTLWIDDVSVKNTLRCAWTPATAGFHFEVVNQGKDAFVDLGFFPDFIETVDTCLVFAEEDNDFCF